jgi:hypothetical protein
MKNANKFTSTSIFNENLQVTKELHAVTYGKRSYNSLKPASPERRAEPLASAEHAFIIIQTHKTLYRAEIWSRKFPMIETIVEGKKILTKPDPAFDYVIIDKKRTFDDRRTFDEALPEILDEQELTNIVNHTWLIPKDRAQELMEAISADMGSIILEEKNSIPYFVNGNESLEYPGKALELRNECFRMMALVGSVGVAAYQVKAFFTNAKAHQELKASATHLCENSGCALDTLKKTFGLMTAALSPLWTRVITDSAVGPKKEFPKVHSCASWAAEKLLNLEIDEINNDLEPSLLVTLLDKWIYITTLHLGDMEEIRTAIDRNGAQNPKVAQIVPDLHRAVDTVEHVKERKNNLLTTEDHKATRCVIATGGVLIAAIATSKIKDVVVDNCFDR